MRNDKEARTTGGIPGSDDLAQQLADEAEAGYDVAVLRRAAAGDADGSGPADVVRVRLGPDLRASLAARADAEHTSASDVIRQPCASGSTSPERRVP